MKKRILAMLLAIMMLVGALPMNAFATEATDPAVVLCETEGCEYASGHEGNCSNYVAPTEACTTEGCTYGANHEGNCSNFVACETEDCEYVSGHEGNCSNYVAPTEVCTTEGCTYGANHEGNCSNFVACETEGYEYVSDHEGNCSNYVAPTEACATEGCTYGANHEGDCSNYVAPTECETEGCTLGYGHEGDCGTSSDEEADAETADQAAAQNVIDLITAIGEVTLESEAAIAAADAAYNNLTDAQKVLVTNLDVLETAKSTYSALTVPAPVEAAADAVVYVTVNNKGVLGKANDGSIMVNKSVTVTDINSDGSLSYDEALVAAHAAYNSADGYVTEDYEESGKTVTKLWGVDNGVNYLFFINGSPITMNVAESYVAAGNSLYISVLSEMTYGADWYTYFDKTNLTVKAGEEFALTLKGYQGRSDNPAAVAVSGASVGTWQSGSFSAIEGKTTDANGAVTLSFDKAGTYYVTASGTVSDTVYGMTVECPTMAPVCVVTVEGAAEEDTTPKAPYFAELKVKMGAGSAVPSVNILEADKYEYDLSIPANNQNMYVTAVLSEAAPEGSAVNATFTNYRTGAETTIAITKANTHMSGALSNDITPTTVKITVGVDGNIQTYTLNVSRTMALGTATFKDAAGTSLTQLDGKYLVPEALQPVIIKANSYGAALTINGQIAVSKEDYSFTPTWDANNECNVEVVATHNGETLSNSYVLKLYKEGDTLTGTCGDNVTWSLTGDVLTISGTGAMADYSDSSSNRPSWKPFVSSIKSVVVESGVTHIGNYAFYQTTTLERVTLNEGVKTVGQNAFNGCTALKNVNFSSTVASIGNFAFNGCTALSEITLPAGLTTLGNRVFQNCEALTKIEIPSSVTTVGTYVFRQCIALESAVIKGTMGEDMFNECIALKNVTISGPTEIPADAFYKCLALESVVIPEGVETVADYAFGYCTALKSVTIPGTVKNLSARAFYGCTNLTDITFNGSEFVQKDGLLYTADGTTVVMCLSAEGAVTIANGVTTINDSVFYNNTKITSVKLPETLTKIGASAFYGCTNLEAVNVPDSVTEIGASAFRDCAKLTAVNIPEGITALENNVFNGCSGLTSVTLPSTLTSIGNSVFQKCTGLTPMVIPEGVTTLGVSAFNGCTALESVNLPVTLTSLGMGCFGGCTALKTVEIPENVTSLPAIVFNSCTSLETIVLPAGLTSINNGAFNNTPALTLVGFRGSPEQWAAVTGNGKPTVTVAYYYGRTDVASVAKHPEELLLVKGTDAANALSVTANPVDEGITISYTWYRNTEDSTTGGTVVENTVSEDGLTSYCTPSTAETGISYYYCILSTVSDGVTYNIPSETAPVTVLSYMWEGEGTEEKPYLVNDAEGIHALYDFVASGESTEGLHFKMTADITLPEGWEPIGVLIDPSVGHINRGANMYAFSGTIDGNGKTLTVPEGGLPLLGYVNGATVKNLNIYGKKIAGYGLVNHLEGVGLSGEAICIDNVTLLSGTQTLKSGLIGTYLTNNGFAGCSAAFYVTIRNCTVQEGVVIGYNKDQTMIGSIAGRVHGTIDNCVSYATVYGKDYVGGILGTRDNAMGATSVTNCQFHGTVEASGTFAGGILGGGYHNTTAPNGNRVSINNCTVAGSVTGTDKVGGITGGDPYVAQAWGGHTVKNNSFTGKVRATEGTYVGGIIGYYDSLNKYDDISGNYYKSGCGADRGIGYVQYVDTSCETHETESGATYINTADGVDECPAVTGCAWKTGLNRTDDPLGADAANLAYTDAGAEPVDVTMTVSNKGTLALANGTVTVKDTNADGILTYHEALEAAHAAYCEGGYTAAETDYGISVSEIWGVETYNSLYFRNGEKLANHVGNTETSTVAEGDSLVVSVNRDDTYYSDRYSSFNATTKNVVKGKQFTLTLKADLSTGSTVVPNATIGTWNNGVFTPLEGKITNEKGQVTLSFAETGTYIISASGTVSDTVQDWSNGGAEVTADCPLIAPVCVVTVVEAPRLADLRVSKVWADSGDYYEMTPAFDPYVTEYTVHVPDYTSSIFPYVTQAETNVGTRTAYYCCVRGFGMFGWTTSNNISLSSNTYFGAVIYGTSSTSMSDEDIRYTVNISKYATLKSLDVDGTAIIDFDRGTNDGAHYYVDGTAEGVKMTPTAHNAAYTVTINGTSVTSGSEYTLPYTWDENGQMEVSITVSGTSVEENTYTLVLEKMPLNDAPFIMKEGTEADYTVIDDASTVEALFVTASANGELAYQWYYNTTKSNENGILIEGATESTYTPPITEDVIGTRYYYCVVTNTGKTEGNTTASTATRITVDPDPTPVAVITNTGSELTGYAWNIGYVYNVGDVATALNITASSAAEGGELSYRWFALDKAYNGSRTYINSEDAYTASYTPSTELSTANTDGKYYGCQVTYAFKGKNYTSWATTGKTVTEGEGEDTKTYDVTGVYVFIKVNKAEVPEITRQPASATYLVGKNMSNLRVNASVADGGKLTYQWYVNDTNSTEGGTAIEDATTTSYKLGTATEIGTKYYYCVVTNTIQGYTSSAVSEVAEITVQAAQNVIGEKLSGSGTEEDPFLIVDAQDYQDVYDFVVGGQNFEGLYLKQTGENITLPENWTPIGTSKTKFSGTLDGNGKTVTVPEGGLPLFGYVNGATVKNLNIYGKKIAGYGLVNNLEGVGMSGEAICIDNVTLKSGSSTLKSGLIGTYITSNMYAGCSATYYVTIKNCTIEEGVVIGYNKDQSMIGSFAGRVHGTIENCVSYATVYGKDYVGGIVGTQDNALGGTVITDSQFHGKVEAMGQHAGGIAGGGYSHSSGPNGNKININDCTVTGTITGADKVGGIIGGDTYVAQLWGGHTLKNNSFTGTVKATSGTYVGGIIGFYDSLNKYDDISGNYYKAGCGAAKGIGFVQYVDTSSQTHETQSGAVYFNTGDGTEECPTVAGCGWKAGHNRTDDPLGADAAKLCYTDTDTDPIATELKVSGTYKTEYTTGEKLDLTGIVLTVVYNDKSEKTIKLSDATVTGYDANKVGEQELTISYNGLTALITVKVENPKGEIKVTVTVYGDSKHGDNGTVHTLSGGGLITWGSATTYTVDSNSTVWDVLQKAFADNGITCNAGSNNSQGTVYISALTRNGVTLAEFDNGTNSGWMYTLNGNHSDNGVAQQYLKDGDKIVFHYTDDYTKEQGSEGNDDEEKDAKAAEAAQKLIDAIGTVTLNSADEIEAAREAYDNLTYAQKQLVDNYAKLTAAETKYAELKAEDDEKKAAAVEKLIDKISAGSTTFEDDVKAAQKAYNALTADQKKLVDNYSKLANALKELADEENKEAAEAVEKLIVDLGIITLDSEDDIKAAREAYDKLTDEQKALVENLADLEAAEEKLAVLKADAVTEDIYKTTGDYIENLGTPVPGSVGGEWMVIGLVRSDREVPGAEDYYASVVKYVQENIDENERLHSAKSTDNSRIILALTAMGKDVTNVDGHNLLNGLNDMAFIQKQGINGPIWALIAFDSGNYPTPEGDVTREALIQVILDAQLADGGWALSGETSDADITGMAVQALAPYYENNADVKKALDEAIETLSKMQAADGSYGSIDGTSSESIAQIIVALAALGIDADKDERFVKNGISAVDALCAFYVEGGGFKHLMDGALDGMATEQGYYALTAYFRMLDDKTSLYNMTDVMDMGGDVEAVEPTETLPAETEPAPTEPVQIEDDDKGGFPWWIIIALLIAGAVVVVIVNRKKIFASVR